MHRHFLALCTIPVILAILGRHHGIRGAAALNDNDIPEQCRSRCDASVSMLNNCGLDTAGRNMDQDNSACFCQNLDKANYHDCANCVRDYQNQQSGSGNDSQNDDDGDYDNENGNDNNNADDSSSDIQSDDDNEDGDGDNGSRKRAIHFGRSTPVALNPRHRSLYKRELLADLLNLDGLVCTANGVVSDALSIVGGAATDAVSLVTKLVGPTPSPSSSRNDDPQETITDYVTVTKSGWAESSVSISKPSLVLAMLVYVVLV